jgi:hypothetical protein
MTTPSFDTSAYIFECCCGERFNNVGAASVCKKCRNYSVWGYTKYVTNTKTGEVVYGEMPTDEEYAKAEVEAEKRWDEEARELAEWKAEQDAEYEHYLLEEAAKKEAAAKAAKEEEEDWLFWIQDKMLGLM